MIVRVLAFRAPPQTQREIAPTQTLSVCLAGWLAVYLVIVKAIIMTVPSLHPQNLILTTTPGAVLQDLIEKAKKAKYLEAEKKLAESLKQQKEEWVMLYLLHIIYSYYIYIFVTTNY